MPFADETFDYAFSFDVLMHAGDTRQAVRKAGRVLKNGGQLNIWVYGAIPVHIDNEEAVRGISDWQTGIWGKKQLRFYR